MSGNAVHIGAGNIGRGFIGQLYFESGYHTTFIDVVDVIVEALQVKKSYPIKLVTDDVVERIQVENVDAVHGKDQEAAASVLAEADIASTAVGLNAMPHIVPLLVRAIEKRFAQADAPPLDIILCENINDAQSYVRDLVLEQLDPAYHTVFKEKVGLVEASIGRMAPLMPAKKRKKSPLLIWTEPYCELPVDKQGFKGPIPAIQHLKPTDNFEAYVKRKLYVHNMTHACTAYMGFVKGYTYIYEAIRDKTLNWHVETAGVESCRALNAQYGLDLDELFQYLDDLIARYHNRALGDQIIRVARDPLRKLAPGDRLIGAAQFANDNSVNPRGIAMGIAAALRYDSNDPYDPSVDDFREMLKLSNGGRNKFLKDYCKLNPHEPPSVFVRSYYRELDSLLE